MMKEYKVLLDEHEAGEIFSPIRDRRGVINILMRSIKILMLNSPPPAAFAKGSIVLHISKMSRLFFISDAKIFSVNFPFLVSEKDGALRFYSGDGYDIDHRMTSEILELLNTASLSASDAYGFIEPIVELTESNPNIWPLFRDLIIKEEGYLRYDYDAAHQNGRLHPLHHIDVFYTSNSSFKVGLDSGIGIAEFHDILNSESDCHYLRSR